MLSVVLSKMALLANTKHIPDDVRKLAVRLNNYRKSSAAKISNHIRKTTGISYSRYAYAKLLKKYSIHGSVSTLPKSGRPSEITVTHKDFIDSCMMENDELTAKQLVKRFFDRFGLNVSVSNMNLLRKKLGWKNEGTKYCQLVSEVSQKKRQIWALQVMQDIRNGDKLDNVLFTDESSFQLNCPNYYHLTNKRLGHKGKKPTPKHPYKSHVWGGISKRGTTKLCIFTGIMKADFYADTLLEQFAAPFIREVLPQSHRFQQDNDPKHTSGYAKEKLDSLGLNWWKTPPSSPDLNPIEFLWGVLKRRIRAEHKPRTKNELILALQKCWSEITPADCEKFVDHIGKVLPVVISRRGKASGF